jgi:hypothetical protein
LLQKLKTKKKNGSDEMNMANGLLIAVVLLVTSLPINTFAASMEKLPALESSKQWNVTIGDPDSEDPKANQSKPGYFNVYSMDIKNVGDKDVNIVRVEAYRNEPNSTTEYELFTSNGLSQDSFHHMNFPLYINATKLNVIVTWTKKSDTSKHQRKYREQFVFEQ